MVRYRIIPTLLLHNKGLYKTVQYNLKKGKYVGDPINAIKIFNDKYVDELIFLDIDASKEKREPDFEILKNIASECFMPVAYGGGITTLDQIKKVFQIGIEKVILNTVLLTDITFLNKASSLYGAQSIVASVDVKRNFFGIAKVYNSATKQYSSYDLKTYLKLLEKNGVGEIYLSFVDRDGMLNGYDIKLIQTICEDISVPVIVNGGAKSVEDFANVIRNTNITALSAGSMFVFYGPHKAVLITYPKYDTLLKVLGGS